jgi:hypothetical protein
MSRKKIESIEPLESSSLALETAELDIIEEQLLANEAYAAESEWPKY